MKRELLLIVICIFICFAGNAQSPNYLWAKSGSGTGDDEVLAIAADAGGNLFVTGAFNSASITFGSTTLTSAGSNDFFIVKYDAAGNVIWARSAGGTSFDVGISVSVDANGNALVTGSFNSSSITFGTTTLSNNGGVDFFIAKYDSSGNVLWAKSAGSSGDDRSNGISVDAAGNVLIAGYFEGSSITFGTTTLINFGIDNIFVAKYDSSGNVLWAKSAGGISADEARAISTDASGNVLVTGLFQSPSITFGTTTLTNSGGYDYFIVKYDTSGNALWAGSAGASANDAGVGIAADAGENVLVTGYFGPSITFGTTTLTSSGSYDIFVVKYNSSGTVLWAKSAGGTDFDQGNGISTDANGNVLVTGYFASASATFGTTVLINAASTIDNIFIAKYDSSGNVSWASSAGGAGYDDGNGIVSDANGNVCVAGSFESDSVSFGSTTLTNSGSFSNDIFITKLDEITGIPEINNSFNAAKAFPNPAKDFFTVEVNAVLKNSCIEIRNTPGEIVYSGQFTGERQTISSRKFSPGIYFIRVIDGEKQFTGKIIIKKN